MSPIHFNAPGSASWVDRVKAFMPIFEWAPQYDQHTLVRDLVAAASVTIMLIPHGQEKMFSLQLNWYMILFLGGILCLADLDHNCLNHYGLSERLEKTIQMIMECQMKNNNFDPYAGRKLHHFLCDAGMVEIKSDVRPHHLIYGELSDLDRWHWWQKIELAGKRSGWTFDDYAGGYEEFVEEFKAFFSSPQRFTYTPIIISRGVNPGD